MDRIAALRRRPSPVLLCMNSIAMCLDINPLHVRAAVCACDALEIAEQLLVISIIFPRGSQSYKIRVCVVRGVYLCSYRPFPPLRLVSCCLIHQQYHLGLPGYELLVVLVAFGDFLDVKLYDFGTLVLSHSALRTWM